MGKKAFAPSKVVSRDQEVLIQHNPCLSGLNKNFLSTSYGRLPVLGVKEEFRGIEDETYGL